jgi:hypothetical protein
MTGGRNWVVSRFAKYCVTLGKGLHAFKPQFPQVSKGLQPPVPESPVRINMNACKMPSTVPAKVGFS